MTDITSAPLTVVDAPSAIPLNIASVLRLIFGAVAGWLINATHGDPSQVQFWVGLGMAGVALLWIHFKNTNAVRELGEWMQTEPVTVAVRSLQAKAPPQAAALLALLAFLPLMGGCSLLENVATDTPVRPPEKAEVAIVSAEYGFEATYNVASRLYLASRSSLPPAAAATIRADLLKIHGCTPAGVTPKVCAGYLDLARQAIAAADPRGLTDQIAAIAALANEISELLGQPIPAPTREPLA